MEFSDKKIKIIEAVEEQLRKSSSTFLSAREIAKAANINLAMISYYFGSKDKLFESVVSYRYIVESKAFTIQFESIKQHLDLVKQLELLIDLYAEKAFYFKTLQRITEENPSVGFSCKPDIINFHMTLVKMFEEIIQKGIDQKTFTLKVDIKMLVGSIIGTLLFFVKSRVFVQEFITKDHPEEEKEKHLATELKNHLKTMIYLMIGL